MRRRPNYHIMVGVTRMLLALLLISACTERTPARIAVTTSLEGSGLLAALAAGFRRDRGIELQAFVVGSGQALRLADAGEVDVVITHDPDAERAFAAKHRPALYRQFAESAFAIVGPPDDPARVAEAATAVDAFRRIAAARAPFCSRNDESATHTRERELWRRAGVDVSAAEWHLKLGQGMAALLRSSDDRGCYTLTDTATFARLSKVIGLRELHRGDPLLRNVYAITLLRGADAPSRAFAEWLLSDRGRAVVGGFPHFRWTLADARVIPSAARDLVASATSGRGQNVASATGSLASSG